MLKSKFSLLTFHSNKTHVPQLQNSILITSKPQSKLILLVDDNVYLQILVLGFKTKCWQNEQRLSNEELNTIWCEFLAVLTNFSSETFDELLLVCFLYVCHETLLEFG